MANQTNVKPDGILEPAVAQTPKTQSEVKPDASKATPVKTATVVAPEVEPDTPEVKPSAMTIDEQGEQLLAQQAAVEDCFKRLANGEDISQGRWAILRRFGPHDQREFNKWVASETTRIGAIRRQQGLAGSSADRRQADEMATKKAEEKLAKRRPEIAEQIATLQSELAGLETEAKSRRDAYSNMLAAVKALRDDRVLPAHVKDRLNDIIRRNDPVFRTELRTSEGRLVGVDGLAKLDPGKPEDREVIKNYVRSNRDLGRSDIERLRGFFQVFTSADSTSVGDLRPGAWASHLTELQTEAKALRKKIAKLKVKEDEEAAEIGTLRDYYVPE